MATRQTEVAVTAAETAPLLGPNGSTANGTAHTPQSGATNGTFVSAGDPEGDRDVADAENGDADGAAEGGDIQKKPEVNMAALLPALAIGVSHPSRHCVTKLHTRLTHTTLHRSS